MEKPFDKFVSSKLKLWLINVIIVILLFQLVSILVYFSSEENSIYAFLFSFVLIYILIALYVKAKWVYRVFLFKDKFVFRNFIGKSKECRFVDIVDIYIMSMTRDEPSYILITENENQILRFGFPFKFSVNEKTTEIVKRIWSKEIKTI